MLIYDNYVIFGPVDVAPECLLIIVVVKCECLVAMNESFHPPIDFKLTKPLRSACAPTLDLIIDYKKLIPLH